MITAYVPDVGDGLAAGIRTLALCDMQIDCGSQNKPEAAFVKGLRRIDPDVFLLSHFHVDHYNGLFQWWRFRPLSFPRIEKVYFPRLPKFPQRENFLQCILAMNHWLMGDTTGSMEADFLHIMRRINFRPFMWRRVSSGDRLHVGGAELEILWPPQVIEEKRTLRVVDKAISDFEKAMRQDETLHRIYVSMRESDEMWPYVGDEEHGELPGRGDQPHDTCEFPTQVRELPDVVKRANVSLRKAANHLSLALHEDNRFLFMGDLEAHEIREVTRDLLDRERDRFLVLITPHHGTHWHRDLGHLRAWWAISSVGEHLFGRVHPEFKLMAHQSLFTHLSGDIEVPFPFAWWHNTKPLGCLSSFMGTACFI